MMLNAKQSAKLQFIEEKLLDNYLNEIDKEDLKNQSSDEFDDNYFDEHENFDDE